MRFVPIFLFICLFCFSAFSKANNQGREKRSEWRIEAEQRIEQIRKADITVLVLDDNNKPIADADVHLRMMRHAFPFGSAVSAKFLTAKNNDAKKYQRLVMKNYNKVVLEGDLKLRGWAKSKTNPPGSSLRIDQTFTALEWLQNNNIPVRGHYLVWGWLDHYKNISGFPDNPEHLLIALKDHIKEKKSKVGKLVIEWDALNHPLSRNTKQTLETSLGQNVYADILKYVKTLEPDVMLYINEGSLLPVRSNSQENLDAYEELIRRLITQGSPLDGIGFMGHMSKDTLRSPEELLEIMDRFSAFGLPIQITEFDVIFGKRGEKHTFTNWELKLQADYTRDFMTAMFSHSAVNGIIMWGFWEGRHWYPGAALYRKDWSIKPNGHVWEDLVFNKWWTDIKIRTDNSGVVSHRVFLGEYEIVVTYGDKRVCVPYTLTKDGAVIELVMKDELFRNTPRYNGCQ